MALIFIGIMMFVLTTDDYIIMTTKHNITGTWSNDRVINYVCSPVTRIAQFVLRVAGAGMIIAGLYTLFV